LGRPRSSYKDPVVEVLARDSAGVVRALELAAARVQGLAVVVRVQGAAVQVLDPAQVPDPVWEAQAPAAPVVQV